MARGGPAQTLLTCSLPSPATARVASATSAISKSTEAAATVATARRAKSITPWTPAIVEACRAARLERPTAKAHTSGARRRRRGRPAHAHAPQMRGNVLTRLTLVGHLGLFQNLKVLKESVS